MLREAYRRRATVSQCVIVGAAIGAAVWGVSGFVWMVVDWIRSNGLQTGALIGLIAGGVVWCLQER